MTHKWNKRVLFVGMQWDYGNKNRGASGDKLYFSDNIARLVSQVEIFWYDEYLKDLPRLRELLLEKAKRFNPDLIFYPTYTNQLDESTLRKLKANWDTCAWFGDDTWRFKSYSSKLAPHFTHICTTDPFSVGEYQKLGIRPILTQWAAQPLPDLKGPLDAGEKYAYDISFVGARNEVRTWFIGQLGKAGLKVDCFGAGWPNGRVSFEEMNNIFRTSKINLNLSNSINRDIRFVLGGARNFLRYCISPKTVEQIKARNFEIPFAGGFQLANYVIGLERYLEIGEEIAVYSSPEDCISQIKYFILNADKRYAIMHAGHIRTKKEHTYLSRFEKIFQAIWPL